MALPKRIKIKGPKSGYCSICKKFGPLSFDHIPPKGTVTIRPVEIRSLTQHFYEKRTKATISQNGVKFRTICERCNNELLGHLYDPELIKFTNDVSLFLRARIDNNLEFPPKQHFEVKSQKLLRSVIGHILAGFIIEDSTNEPIDAPFPNALRNYFLDHTKPIPEKLRVYFWLYPSKNQVLMRGFGFMSLRFKGVILGDLMKFFPIAYWLVWDKPNNIKINQPELCKQKDLCLEESEVVNIDFRKIPNEKWPENPGDDEMILLSEQSTSYSVYKKKKMKTKI
jgi:hypothetical protein